jgi:alternative ribosome-rescue factor
MRRKQHLPHEHGRGTIQDNALQALVTSPLYRTRVVTPKKGKGSYHRKQGRPHQQDALSVSGRIQSVSVATQSSWLCSLKAVLQGIPS